MTKMNTVDNAPKKKKMQTLEERQNSRLELNGQEGVFLCLRWILTF